MEILFLVLIILIGNTFSTIVGFGLNSLALPFLNLFFDVKVNIVALIFLNILNGLVVLIDRKNIDWKNLGTIVLYMLLGLPFGLGLFYVADAAYLKLALGIFMVIAGTWGILKATVKRFENMVVSKTASRVSLFFGGVLQGAIASAGMFVVLYADRELTDKKKFRTTLMMMWVIMNCIQVVQYYLVSVFTSTAVITPDVTKLVLIGVLPLFAGMWLGFQFSKKVDKRTFGLILNSIIVFAGAINIYTFIAR